MTAHNSHKPTEYDLFLSVKTYACNSRLVKLIFLSQHRSADNNDGDDDDDAHMET